MSSATILVVDDEANIRTSVRLCLEGAGYVVAEASNGLEALEIVEREKPDLVVLDLMMPVMDGMSVLAEFAHMWTKNRMRVIVATAHGSVKAAIHAVRLGASDFLEKPFLPEELRMSVAGVLRESPPANLDFAEDYSQVLEHVRRALRERRFHEAERELMKAGTITGEDSAFLNLAGILHESHGRIESAARFYERAAARSGYGPAVQNLERLGDLRRTGKTKRSVAFGDQESQELTHTTAR